MAKKKQTEEILPFNHQRALVALKNMTPYKLQIKNNMISGIGSKKGKWMVHKDLHVTPGECTTTDFLEGQTHQIMVYSATGAGAETFFYRIDEANMEDGNSIRLYEDRFEIEPGLLCK